MRVHIVFCVMYLKIQPESVEKKTTMVNIFHLPLIICVALLKGKIPLNSERGCVLQKIQNFIPEVQI